MNQSYAVSTFMAIVVDHDNHCPPLSPEDEHPAFGEGYAAFFTNMLGVGYSQNPYSPEMDAFYEWQDGYENGRVTQKWRDTAWN